VIDIAKLLSGTENRKRNHRDEAAPRRRRFPLSPVSWFLIPVLLAVAIFAHGCHTGEHDDEPVLVPHTSEYPEPPK
jgi:hypothetical protein